jgi:DCC-interacting protein 13 alpha
LSQEPNISFELSNAGANSKTYKMLKPEQGESFKVRFLGSMNVRADRGNEYINEAIRQIMAARANQNIFKSSEFELVVNSESISLFTPLSSIEKNDEVVSSDELLKARFDLENLAFWSPHRENQRLFGFIVKESNKSLKFICHVFESDVDSTSICELINKATQDAFKLLVEENKDEHFKRMKSVEKEILLHNIKSLPDKASTAEEKNNEGSDLLNALINSPNPNFVVLDKETLNSTLNQQQNLEETENGKDSKNESEA